MQALEQMLFMTFILHFCDVFSIKQQKDCTNKPHI